MVIYDYDSVQMWLWEKRIVVDSAPDYYNWYNIITTTNITEYDRYMQ